jgi:hypothetical protein
MGRPKGSKNRRTILKEAEQHVGAKYVDQVLDSLYVLESAMRHFYIRAEIRKHTNDEPDLIDADYERAARLAALVAPYRHPRLSAVKLAGDPNIRSRCVTLIDTVRDEDSLNNYSPLAPRLMLTMRPTSVKIGSIS